MPRRPHFNTTLEYEELIEMVLKLVMAAVDSEVAAIYRHDPDPRERAYPGHSTRL